MLAASAGEAPPPEVPAPAMDEPVDETHTVADEPEPLIEEIVVTATRRKMLLSDTPDVVQVIGGRQIRETNSSSTGRAFEYVTGTSIETGTGSGFSKRSIVGLNGLPANYTLVLVDGVRLLSDHIHTGQNLEMIPPGSIDHIEIIRGAASAQYGTDAIGGVVNVITRRGGDKPVTSFGASAGHYLTYEGNVSVSEPLSDRVRMSLFLNHEQSAGVPILLPAHRVDQMGFERLNFLARVDVDVTDETKFFAWGNFVDNTMEWQDALAKSYLEMETMGGSHQVNPTLNVFAQASRVVWDAEVGDERNELVQPETHLTWDAGGPHTVTGGIDYRHHRFMRSGLDRTREQDTYGGFVQDEWRAADELTLMLALRYDEVEDIGSCFSPKLSALYSPDVPLRLRASISRGFHAPTPQELYEEAYGHGGTALRYGNPDLDAEYSMTYTLGAEFFPAGPVELALYGYYSRIDDMIVPIYEGPDPMNPGQNIWRRTNIAEATVYGGEVVARYTFTPELRLETGFSAAANENEDTGRQLPYDPGWSFFAKAVAGGDINHDWKWSGFVGLRAVYDRSAWSWKPAPTALPTDPDGLTTELSDYTKIEAGVSATYSDTLTLFVNVDNIRGEDYEHLDDVFTKIDGETVVKGGFSLKW